MEEIVSKNLEKSSSEFEKLLAQDLDDRKFSEGEIAEGVITKIDDKYIFVDLGLKSEGMIPIEEFKVTRELDQLVVGQKIEVLLEKLENYNGDLVISRERAKKVRSWKKMERCFEEKKEVQGQIISLSLIHI